MLGSKKIRAEVERNPKDVYKCLKCINNDDSEGLSKLLTWEVLEKPVYPDGMECSKSRLIFHAIKNNKAKCVSSFLKFGLKVDELYTDYDLGRKDFASLSPIHYCIEGKYSMEILEELIASKKKPVIKSEIVSAILNSNEPALRLLFSKVPKSELFNCLEPIHIMEIINCYAEHPEIEFAEILDVVSSFISILENYRPGSFKPVELYLAEIRPNCSFEEAAAIISLCRFFQCSLDAVDGMESPIHVAMDHNNHNFVKALVHYGANLHRLNHRGHSVLYEAFLKKDQDMMEFLLQYGADSQQHNVFEMTDAEIFGLKTKNVCSLNGIMIRSDSCVLFSALKNKDWNLITRIIQLDRNLNIKESNNSKIRYPILFCTFGYLIVQKMTDVPKEFLLQITNECISKGFDINAKCVRNQIINDINFRYHTILHLAIRFFSVDFCKALVKIGADPNLITGYNQCAHSLTLDYSLWLSISYFEKDKLAISEKIAFVVDECKTDFSNTLLPPPYPENSEVCRFNKFGDNGIQSETALQIILKAHKGYVLKSCPTWLISPKTLQIQDLELALRTSDADVIYLVLNDMDPKLTFQGLKISDVGCLFDYHRFQDKNLTFSKECSGRRFLQTICDGGFDINSLDDNGNSIFHFAANCRKFSGTESVELFIQLVISLGWIQSIDCINKRLESPLHWALSTRKFYIHNFPDRLHSGYSDRDTKFALVKVFLRHGADIYRKTSLGYSAIHIAINSGLWNIVKLLIDKSGDIVNSWRRLPSTKIGADDIDPEIIEQVTWPYSAIDMDYIVTPLTVAIINEDEEMIKCLLKEGAILTNKDIHNSLYIKNFKSFKLANFLFEFLPKDVSLESDCLFDGKVPTLEYVFDTIVQTRAPYAKDRTRYNTTELMTFARNFISRKYDINAHRGLKYPPVIISFIQFAIRGYSVPSSNIPLFNYLLDHSDYEFINFNGMDGTQESILTFLILAVGRRCTYGEICAYDLVTGDQELPCVKRRVLVQREYFIRMLLQRIPPSKWDTCYFNDYMYHKEDQELLNHIVLTGARVNLIQERLQFQTCRFGSSSDVTKHLIGLQELQGRIDSTQSNPLSLGENSIMNINGFSPQMRKAFTSIVLPDNIKKLISFLDVEEDKDLSPEIEAHDYDDYTVLDEDIPLYFNYDLTVNTHNYLLSMYKNIDEFLHDYRDYIFNSYLRYD